MLESVGNIHNCLLTDVMASEAYEKVLVMVDKTVNSAGQLLKQLQPRSPQRQRNDGNEKKSSTNIKKEDVVAPPLATAVEPDHTSRRHSDRKPSPTNVKCPDDSSGRGKDISHGDVTIVNAENVFINYDSDSVSLSTSEKSSSALRHRKNLGRPAHVDGSSEALVRKQKTVPHKMPKFKADTISTTTKAQLKQRSFGGDEAAPFKQSTSLRHFSSSRSSPQLRTARHPNQVVPKTDVPWRKQQSGLPRSRSYSSKSSGVSSRHSGRSSQLRTALNSDQPLASMVPTTTRTVSMSCSSRSASSRTKKSSSSKAMTKSKVFPCKGLCHFPHALTVLGPTAMECNQAFGTMRRLHPRDPYRPPKVMTIAEKQVRTTSSLTLPTEYYKKHNPQDLSQILKKPATTTSKDQFLQKSRSSSRKSESCGSKLQLWDPCGQPKKSSTTTIPKKEILQDPKWSSRMSMSFSKRPQPRDPYRPPKTKTPSAMILPKREAPQKPKSSSRRSMSSSKRPQPRDPYRPPKTLSTTILPKREVLQMPKSSSRKSMSFSKRPQPRDPYRPPKKSSTATIPLKETFQIPKSSSRKSMSFGKRPQPRDPYRPPKNLSKIELAKKQVVDRTTSSFRTSIGYDRKHRVRDPYRRVKKSSPLAIANKATLLSSTFTRSNKKLQPRDPYRPPKKTSETMISMREASNRKLYKSTSSSRSSSKLGAIEKISISSWAKELPIKTSTLLKKMPQQSRRSSSSLKSSNLRACRTPAASSSKEVKEIVIKLSTNLDKDKEPSSRSDSSSRKNVRSTKSKAKAPHKEASKKSLRKNPEKIELSTKSGSSLRTAISDDSDSASSASRKVAKKTSKPSKASATKHVRTPIGRSVLGKSITRLESKSIKKKKKSKKKPHAAAEKSESYLDLSNRYAVAGRKIRKHKDDETEKDEIPLTRKDIQESKQQISKLLKAPADASKSSSQTEGEVFENVDVEKLGKSFTRLETHSSMKKRKKKEHEKKKHHVKKTDSYLDLSLKHYAVAGRRLKKEDHAADVPKTTKKSKKVLEPSSDSDSSSKKKAPVLSSKHADSSSKKVSKKKSKKLKKVTEPPSDSDLASARANSDRSNSSSSTSKKASMKISKHPETKLIFTPVRRSPPLGKSTKRLETKSTRKKKKSKKKSHHTPKRSESYLDLTNRYAVAGRKIRQADREARKEKISRAREHIQESRQAIKEQSKYPNGDDTATSDSPQLMSASSSTTMVEPTNQRQFVPLNVEKLGKSYQRTETQWSKKKTKKNQAKKKHSSKKYTSYLDLSLKQHAVHGRRSTTTTDPSSSSKSTMTTRSGKGKKSKKPKTDGSASMETMPTARAAPEEPDLHTARSASTKSRSIPIHRPSTHANALNTTKATVPLTWTLTGETDQHTACAPSSKSISIPIQRSTASLISSTEPDLHTPQSASMKSMSIPINRFTASLISGTEPDQHTAHSASMKSMSIPIQRSTASLVSTTEPDQYTAHSSSLRSISIPIHRSTASLISSTEPDPCTAHSCSMKSISIPIHRSTASLISSTEPGVHTARSGSMKSMSHLIHPCTASLISSRRSATPRYRTSERMATATSAPHTQSSSSRKRSMKLTERMVTASSAPRTQSSSSRKRSMKLMKTQRTPCCRRCPKCDTSMRTTSTFDRSSGKMTDASMKTTSIFDRSNGKMTDTSMKTTSIFDRSSEKTTNSSQSGKLNNTSLLTSPTVDQRLFTSSARSESDFCKLPQTRTEKKKRGSTVSVELPDTNIPIYTLPPYSSHPRGPAGGRTSSEQMDINFDAKLQMRDIDTNTEHTLLISGHFIDKKLTNLILNKRHCRL